MSAQPHRSADVEALLRQALAPVEPPEHLSVRLEDTLTTITALAADELEAWELRTLHDPRTWVRPAVAVGVGTVAAGRPRPPAGAPRSRSPPLRRCRPRRVRSRRGAHDRRRGRAASARMSTQTDTTCYRHPSRETRVSCSSCGRPICPDCMTPSPVGMRCPECSQQTTKVTTLASVGGEPRATIALIAICSIVFLAEGSFGVSGGQGSLFRDGALFGPAVAAGDWWRLVTYGFLHAGLLHIGFNMLLLWLFGREMEPQLGTPIFLGIYFSCLLAGAFGALIFSPDALTVGASGAIFGLMGAAAAILYARGSIRSRPTSGC